MVPRLGTIPFTFVLTTSLALSGFALPGPQPSVIYSRQESTREGSVRKLCRRLNHPTNANIARDPHARQERTVYHRASCDRWFEQIKRIGGVGWMVIDNMLTGGTLFDDTIDNLQFTNASGCLLRGFDEV